MPMPKELLDRIAADIKEAEGYLAEVKDVVSDMRLAGMDTSRQVKEIDDLEDKLRQLRVFHERQKAKLS